MIAVDRRAEALQWVRREAELLSIPVECIETDFTTHRFRRRFDLVVHIFTGVTTTDHLARLVSNEGFVLWRETWNARDTEFDAFEVCATFREQPGLRVLRRRCM